MKSASLLPLAERVALFLSFLSMGLLEQQKHRSAIHTAIALLVADERFKTVYKDL